MREGLMVTVLLMIVSTMLIHPVCAQEFKGIELPNNINEQVKLSNIGDWQEILGKLSDQPLVTVVVIIGVILVLLWIIAIPSRIAIETAGRILGFDPEIGNFGALFLFILYSISPIIGIIAFVLKFNSQAGTLKSIILAILSVVLFKIAMFIFKAIALILIVFITGLL